MYLKSTDISLSRFYEENNLRQFLNQSCLLSFGVTGVLDSKFREWKGDYSKTYIN